MIKAQPCMKFWSYIHTNTIKINGISFVVLTVLKNDILKTTTTFSNAMVTLFILWFNSIYLMSSG